jgi:hypothetical protein
MWGVRSQGCSENFLFSAHASPHKPNATAIPPKALTAKNIKEDGEWRRIEIDRIYREIAIPEIIAASLIAMFIYNQLRKRK